MSDEGRIYTDEELAEMDADEARWHAAKQEPLADVVESIRIDNAIEAAAAFERVGDAETFLELLVGPLRRVIEGKDDTPIAGMYEVTEAGSLDGWATACAVTTPDRTYAIVVVER